MTALIHLLKEKTGMQYRFLKEKQIYLLALIKRGSDLQYILYKSIAFFQKNV